MITIPIGAECKSNQNTSSFVIALKGRVLYLAHHCGCSPGLEYLLDTFLPEIYAWNIGILYMQVCLTWSFHTPVSVGFPFGWQLIEWFIWWHNVVHHAHGSVDFHTVVDVKSFVSKLRHCVALTFVAPRFCVILVSLDWHLSRLWIDCCSILGVIFASRAS